ncbi:hypothetical protein ABO04_11300 [Nitrosomonas sp. HPC101]|nr:hypothetical protein [Nitrosomonas sp. HPC101]
MQRGNNFFYKRKIYSGQLSVALVNPEISSFISGYPDVAYGAVVVHSNCEQQLICSTLSAACFAESSDYLANAVR